MVLATDWLEACSTFGLFVVAAVTAKVAASQFLKTSAAEMEARKERRQIARDEARPYIVVTLENTPDHMHFADLVVRNYGKTMARNVSLDFAPAFARAVASEYLAIGPWPTMAPGQEFRTLFDYLVERDARKFPDRYELGMVYADDHGKQFAERQTLDLRPLRGVLSVGEQVDSAEKSLEAIAQSLKARRESVSPSRGIPRPVPTDRPK